MSYEITRTVLDTLGALSKLGFLSFLLEKLSGEFVPIPSIPELVMTVAVHV